MGKVYDTTNQFSIFEKKSRTYKNMSKDNYYLKNLQKKIDDEWKYRPNIVDIEEEKEFGSETYNSVEVKIQNVYDEKLKKVLSDDWKKINFKDIQHPIILGQRYRFSLDFNNKDEPLINKSIWIVLNVNKTNPSFGGILRRCDNFFTIISDNGTIHYEPVCLDTDFKYTSIYYDLSISIAQGEIYATMQYNKYTKFLKINDRFIVGPVDTVDRHNNTIYKIKALRRYQNLNTFDSNSVPLVFFALERDDIGSEDDLITRLVKSNGMYRESDFFQKSIDLVYDSEKTILIAKPKKDIEEAVLKDVNDLILSYYKKGFYLNITTDNGVPIDERILLNETRKYYCYLYEDDKKIECPIKIEVDLLSTDKDVYYYDFIQDSDNSFIINNKKMYLKDELKIRCYCEDSNNKILAEKEFSISLGGFM